MHGRALVLYFIKSIRGAGSFERWNLIRIDARGAWCKISVNKRHFVYLMSNCLPEGFPSAQRERSF